jgi:hypothetical protein
MSCIEFVIPPESVVNSLVIVKVDVFKVPVWPCSSDHQIVSATAGLEPRSTLAREKRKDINMKRLIVHLQWYNAPESCKKRANRKK